MQYIELTINKLNHEKNITIYIEDEKHINKIKITFAIPFPLEIINGKSDTLIIPVYANGLINQAYIKRKLYIEQQEKEELITEYLEIPNIFLFSGVNHIMTNYKNSILKIKENKIWITNYTLKIVLQK